jgi:pyruvate formate lyase activating enzyme
MRGTMMNKPIIGRIHSVETFGAVDGPGVRYVLFMQGCPLRCLYCHNPDSWDVHSGKEITSEEAADDIKKYMNFIKRGGVTISGGEPLLQSEFVEDLILRCKALGLHTAIDTSGAIPLEKSQKAIDASDLLLLDIKSLDDDVCKNLTGTSNINTLKTLDYCEHTHKPVWIRHVIVPGITLKTDLLENLADFLKNYTCIENIEILPFHKMGEFKWQDMNLKYSLFDTPQPENDEIQKAKEIFLSRNLPIKL